MNKLHNSDSSLKKNRNKPSLLLHICCAPCATHTVELLKKDFCLTGLFYNPNIQPEMEFNRRKDEAQRLASLMNFNLICQHEGQAEWFESVKGLEKEPEGGKRCSICYEFRLDKAARFAKENGFTWLATTLTISPHKKATIINEIGKTVSEKYGLNFFAADFKKKDGFKISCELSEKYQLYRQDYCGCLFSLATKKDRW